MSKQEDSKLNKIKHFFRGIGGSKGASFNLDNVKPPTREFIFTNDVLKEISPGTPANTRIKKIRDLCETVLTRRLEDNAVEAIWLSTKDLLRETTPTDDRHLMLWFLQCLIKGQYTHLGLMRAHFFAVVKGHTLFEDLALRLDLFKVLSSDGKDLEYFEEETGAFLMEWMGEVISTNKITDFLCLLVNVIKFNAAYMDEEIISGLVMHTCLIATQTRLETDVELCLKVLDTVVCYSYLPSESLFQLTVCLCRIVNVEKFCQDTWTLMRKLLGTHLGHSGVYTMCCILQDKKNITESGASLLRGAVFFVGMALWGSKKVTSLKHPPSAVLPAFYQALVHSGSPKVALEVVLSMQRLVSKYGDDQQMVTWDVILDIVEVLLKQYEPSCNTNTVLRSNIHDLLSNIETLHQEGQFNGSSDRFFGIIEMCAFKRPESSILALISHKAKGIHPSKEHWIPQLCHLVDKYFKQEGRSKIRIKVLEVLAGVITTHRHLYEDELIESVVLPHLAQIELDPEPEVRKSSARLLVDVAVTCQSERCLELISILKKIMNQPFTVAAPVTASPAPGEGSDKAKKQPLDLEDVHIAAIGMVTIFKTKLYQVPSTQALEVYETLVGHIGAHYNHSSIMLQTGSIRHAIFQCLLELRADSLHRLGLPNIHRGGQVTYSPYVTCCYRPDGDGLAGMNGYPGTSSPPVVQSVPQICKTTTLHYAQAFCCVRKCIEEEIDWNVLKILLEKLPLVLQNKTLILATNPEDVDRFCTRLCIMLSDKNVGFPEKLVNAPSKFTKSDFHNNLFPTLTCMVSYHSCLSKTLQRDLVKCLEFGLVSRCARICVRALTVCLLEIQDIMLRQLPSVLLKLSQISATVAMAIPLMEFLSSLIHLPQLYSNFVEDQYMSIFAIALPYTNPFKYTHYTVSLAYHVISMWFLKCRQPFRKGFVGFIVKGLQSNVLRQFEETAALRVKQQNQDSTDRVRSQTLNEATLRSKGRAAVAKVRAGGSLPPPSQDDTLSSFHKELTETCIDMMARYTFSTFPSLPKRSPVEKFLLEGGQSQRWLLGNKIITITTSGGSKVGKAGLCEKCLTMARAASQKADPVKSGPEQPLAGTPGRKRHRSAAVTTTSEVVSIRPRSQDDIQIYRPESRESLEAEGEFSLRRAGSSPDDVRDGDMPRPGLLDTHRDKMDAVDQVLLGLRANPSDTSIFSPQVCNCWCTLWAEVHIRRPTGNLSWMMRIQNEQDPAEFFPDFSLNDISNLLISAPGDSYDMLTGSKIDSLSLEEYEYESLLEEHFYGEGSFGSIPRLLLSHQRIPEEDENIVMVSGEKSKGGDFLDPCEDGDLKKSSSNPDLTTSQNQKLLAGKSSNANLQEAYSRAQDIGFDNESGTPSEVNSPERPDGKGVVRDGVMSDAKSLSSVNIEQDVRVGKPESGPGPDTKMMRPQASPATERSPKGVSSPEESPKTRGGQSTQSPQQAAPLGGSGASRPTTLEEPKKPTLTGVSSSVEREQGGVSPSFLFLQLYHLHIFGHEERPILLPQSEVVNRALKLLDLIYPYETHKIGVIHVAPGQVADETAILRNVYGPPRYMDFLSGLGHLMKLKDCNPSSIFLGGLDQNGNDGLFAYAWHDQFIQVIYHVATLMPNKESDRNCNAKKLHIGNDYVTIVYNHSGENYKIGTIKGQFNYVNIVINPLDHGMNAVTVQTREDIEEVIGHTDTKIISDSNLAVLVRQMAVHANLASTIVQKQKSNPKDPYASNWLERLRQIKRVHSKVLGVMEGQAQSHPKSPFTEDFTDFV